MLFMSREDKVITVLAIIMALTVFTVVIGSLM